MCLDSLSRGMTGAAQALQGSPILSDGLDGSDQDTLVYGELYAAAGDILGDCYLHICDLSGSVRYSTRSTTPTEPLDPNWGILHAARSAGGKAVYRQAPDSAENDGTLLQAAALLKDPQGQEVGYLVMELNREHFWSLFRGKYAPQDDLLLLSRYWRPIYSSQHELSDTLSQELRAQLLSGQNPGDGDPDYIFSVTEHPATGMFLLLQHPQAFSQSTIQILNTVSLSCALIGIVISVVISILTSRQIFAPIRRLQMAFNRVEQDDLSVQVAISRKDELGELAQEFNHMVGVLKSNREELVRNQKALNEARLRMLQAQLNPHFLGNTLDTMKWISKINKVPQVALMSTNLADILRFCISDEEFVFLDRELEIVQRYLEIQRIRLSERFSFHLEVPEALRDCLIPKMILQPIVENAILHGLSGIENSAITVQAQATAENFLRLSVTDNGHGLPEHMAGRPYCRDKAPEGNHLGLYNVDTIIKIDYGDGFGLFMDGGPGGMGTTVTATLPIQRKEA